MRSLELWTLAYLLNSLWQAPLVFAAAWIAARLARRSGPAVKHRIWVSALALEALLPACSLQPTRVARAAWQMVSRLWTSGAADNTARVTVTSGPGYALAHLPLPSAMLAAIVLVYGCTVLYFSLRFLWRLRQTRAIRRQAQREPLTAAAQRIWTRSCGFFAVPDAEVAFSRQIAGPITLGIRHRLVLLPVGWAATLPEDDLSAAIAHEFAHMRRRDFAKNLLYEALALPIAYHPLLWLTRARLAESREMVCDATAAEAFTGREHYARSLLRLASLVTQPTPSTTLHGIGIFDACNFERRIMNLTQKHVELRGARRLAIACAFGAIGVATCASAMALRLNVSGTVSGQTAQSEPAPARAVRVSGGVMAGNILSKVAPVYPPDAKKAGISGAVVLHAIIGSDGIIRSLNVVSGPDELRQSALDAVRQWTYKPYLLNGNPTEVQTTVTVTYSLQH